MSEEKNRLRIHAQITPDISGDKGESSGTVRWKSIPHPNQKRKRGGQNLTYSDRLLRNSALACALLLAILAMGNINQPWARRTSETIERALTMHIDLDESIGRLSFVRNLMPESALVFLNVSSDAAFLPPASGEVSHEYTEAQPWLIFSCPAQSEVFAVADGTVTAVSALPDDAVGILIDHGNGIESVYACLTEASVASGDAVSRGQQIGLADDMLYFELRENELSVNPAERMGL